MKIKNILKKTFITIASAAMAGSLLFGTVTPSYASGIRNTDEAAYEDHTPSERAEKAAGKQDFSSKELLVKVDSDFVSDSEIVAQAEDVYFTEYESADKAKQAYMYYYDQKTKDGFVAPNTEFSVADDKDSSVGTEEVSEDNAIAELDKALNEIKEEKTETDLKASKTVALIDTGVSEECCVTDAVSMIGNDATDDNGHGTKMFAYMKEINPDIQVLSVKVMDKYGKGDAAGIYAGIEYAIERNVDIINLSLYGKNTENNAAVVSALQDAEKAGITVVGAAGNDGKNVKDYFPGNVRSVITTGACDEDGTRISSSNYGDAVDYNVVSDSTSEAAAKMSAFISLYGIKGIEEALNKGLIYETDYEEAEAAEKTTEEAADYLTPDEQYKIATSWTNAGDLSGVGGYDIIINRNNITLDNLTIQSQNLTSAKNGTAVTASIATLKYTTKDTSGSGYIGCLNLSDWDDIWPDNDSAKILWRGINGSLVLVFKNGAKSATKSYDLQMTISNIHLMKFKETSHCYYGETISLLRTDDGGQATKALSKAAPLQFTSSNGYGTYYTVTYKILSSGSGQTPTGTFITGWTDLDQKGHPDSVGGTRSFGTTTDSGTEGIVFSNVDNAYYFNNCTLYPINNRNYTSTSAFATAYTATGSLASTAVVKREAGSNLTFTWSGSSCQTYIGSVIESFARYKQNVMVRYQQADGTWNSKANGTGSSGYGLATNTSGSTMSAEDYNGSNFNLGTFAVSDSSTYNSEFKWGTSSSSVTNSATRKTFSGIIGTESNTWYIDVERNSYYVKGTVTHGTMTYKIGSKSETSLVSSTSDTAASKTVSNILKGITTYIYSKPQSSEYYLSSSSGSLPSTVNRNLSSYVNTYSFTTTGSAVATYALKPSVSAKVTAGSGTVTLNGKLNNASKSSSATNSTGKSLRQDWYTSSSVTITPAANYRIKSVTIDGVAQTSMAGQTTSQTYTFSASSNNGSGSSSNSSAITAGSAISSYSSANAYDHLVVAQFEYVSTEVFTEQVFVRYQQADGTWNSKADGTGSTGYGIATNTSGGSMYARVEKGNAYNLGSFKVADSDSSTYNTTFKVGTSTPPTINKNIFSDACADSAVSSQTWYIDVYRNVNVNKKQCTVHCIHKTEDGKVIAIEDIDRIYTGDSYSADPYDFDTRYIYKSIESCTDPDAVTDKTTGHVTGKMPDGGVEIVYIYKETDSASVTDEYIHENKFTMASSW